MPRLSRCRPSHHAGKRLDQPPGTGNHGGRVLRDRPGRRVPRAAGTGARCLPRDMGGALLAMAHRRRKTSSVSITYLEAIREAQAKALREDPSVFIYGQDIAE